MRWGETKARVAAEAQRLKMEAEPWPPVRCLAVSSLHRHDFIAYSRQEFLSSAYRAVLGREVDPSGLASYDPLCDLWLGRVAVIGHLAFSAEGRAMGVAVRGVRLWRLVHALCRRLPWAAKWLQLADWGIAPGLSGARGIAAWGAVYRFRGALS